MKTTSRVLLLAFATLTSPVFATACSVRSTEIGQDGQEAALAGSLALRPSERLFVGDDICAIAEDGAVYCLNRRRGPSTSVAATGARLHKAPLEAKAVALSGFSGYMSSATCAVLVSGKVSCFLSGAAFPDSGTLPTIPGIDGATSVAVVPEGDEGIRQGCAVDALGAVKCWAGSGPASPIAGIVARSIAVGYNLACAVRLDGGVSCWGNNTLGTLGIGTTADSATPVTVSGLSDVSRIAISNGSVMALTVDGTLYTWGASSQGKAQCTLPTPGNPQQTPCNLLPELVHGPSATRAISFDGQGPVPRLCELSDVGLTTCQGEASFFGGAPAHSETDAMAVGTTTRATCALRKSGSLACWGYLRDHEGKQGSRAVHVIEIPASRP